MGIIEDLQERVAVTESLVGGTGVALREIAARLDQIEARQFALDKPLAPSDVEVPVSDQSVIACEFWHDGKLQQVSVGDVVKLVELRSAVEVLAQVGGWWEPGRTISDKAKRVRDALEDFRR